MKTRPHPKVSWRVMFATIAGVLLALRLFVGGAAQEKAPDWYESRCAACGNVADVNHEDLQRLHFIRMHPEQYHDQFTGESRPRPIQCKGCGMLFRDATLTVCPDTGERYVKLESNIKNATDSDTMLATVNPASSY